MQSMWIHMIVTAMFQVIEAVVTATFYVIDTVVTVTFHVIHAVVTATFQVRYCSGCDFTSHGDCSDYESHRVCKS